MIAHAMDNGPLGEAVGDGRMFLLCPSIGPNMCQMSPFRCVFLLQYPNDIAGVYGSTYSPRCFPVVQFAFSKILQYMVL